MRNFCHKIKLVSKWPNVCQTSSQASNFGRTLNTFGSGPLRYLGRISRTCTSIAVILSPFSPRCCSTPIRRLDWSVQTTKKVEVAHTQLPSVGFRSWSRFLAVSLQVTWVINPAVGCHYFPQGLQLPPQPLNRLLPILLGEQRHNGCEQFA